MRHIPASVPQLRSQTHEIHEKVSPLCLRLPHLKHRRLLTAKAGQVCAVRSSHASRTLKHSTTYQCFPSKKLIIYPLGKLPLLFRSNMFTQRSIVTFPACHTNETNAFESRTFSLDIQRSCLQSSRNSCTATAKPSPSASPPSWIKRA